MSLIKCVFADGVGGRVEGMRASVRDNELCQHAFTFTQE